MLPLVQCEKTKKHFESFRNKYLQQNEYSRLYLDTFWKEFFFFPPIHQGLKSAQKKTTKQNRKIIINHSENKQYWAVAACLQMQSWVKLRKMCTQTIQDK